MSSFYSILASLQPNAADVQAGEIFAQSYLQAQFPNVDFRDGTGIYDLVVRPMGSFAALMKAAMEFYFANYTIAGASDTTPSAFIDAIMSNWFSTRNMGTNAVINVNLYFASSVNVTLTTAINFSPDNSTIFNPISNAVYPASMLQYDSYSQEYYLNVNLQAASVGSQYNLSSGDLLYFTNFNPFFLRGTINYLVSNGTDTETNTQFIQRTQAGISTRNLINRPSIESFITTNFPYVTDVTTVGYGDPQMLRDTITVFVNALGDVLQLHVGGMMDIYCYVPVTETTILMQLDDSGNGLLQGPIYSVAVAPSGTNTGTLPSSSTFTTGSSGTISSSGTVIPSGDVGFSQNQVLTLSFSASASGQTVSIDYSYFQYITDIQTGVSSTTNKVICANPLIRAFNSYFLTINIGTYFQGAISPTLLPIVQNYISSLAPGQAFIVSDLLTLLGIPQVALPVTVEYFLTKTDLTSELGTFSDVLEPPDDTYVFYLSSFAVNPISLPTGPYSS